MSHSTFAIPAILAITLLSGCSSPPATPPSAATAGTAAGGTSSLSAPPTAAPAGASTPIAPVPVANVRLAPHLDPKNPLSAERSVYFGFEESLVQGAYLGLVERQGKYLASQPALSVRIEGNTDERGGSEYNLALGQKRAEAVLKAMKIYGVRDAQMEAVSWGQERPKAAGHGEPAWAQNRRADIVYPAK